jgi:hypothetical protein
MNQEQALATASAWIGNHLTGNETYRSSCVEGIENALLASKSSEGRFALSFSSISSIASTRGMVFQPPVAPGHPRALQMTVDERRGENVVQVVDPADASFRRSIKGDSEAVVPSLTIRLGTLGSQIRFSESPYHNYGQVLNHGIAA